MAPTEPYGAGSSRRRGDAQDGGRGDGTRRDADKRRQGWKSLYRDSRDEHGSRPRPRSHSPASSGDGRRRHGERDSHRYRHGERSHAGRRGDDSAGRHAHGRRRSRSRENGHADRSARRSDAGSGDDSGRERKSVARHRGPLPSQQDSFAVDAGEAPEKPKEKPNWANTGVLAAASNSVTQADGTSIALKYHEPSEARKPSPRDEWKLFVFKGGDVVDTIDLGAKSCWLVGRDASVVDLQAEHPSISKQHAVLQFRYTEKRNEFGDKLGRVKPYLLDLDSANGTVLNDSKIPESRYLELRHKDMIQFGHSTREYIMMLAPRD